MNHKRRKPRRKVRCTMCTKYRNGNAKWDVKPSDRRKEDA